MPPDFRPDRLAVTEPTPRIAPWWAWPIAAIAIFAAAAGGVYLTPADGSIAAWWPAAGLSVLFVLIAGRRRRWAAMALVLVVTAAANVMAGRDPLVSVLYGVANAAETATVSLILQRGDRVFRLRTAFDALRFIAAAALGAAVIGVLAGAVAAAFGGDGFAASALHAMTSHAAAVLLIAPFAVLPPRLADWPRWPETAAQTVLLAATVAVVFAPVTYLPLSFIPFVFMAWAAFRFPVHVALAQALLTSFAVMLLTLLGRGPFAADPLSTFELVLVIEAYMIVMAVFTVLLVSARYEVRVATRTALSVSQLIAGGLVDSRVGLLIGEDADDRPRVLWANRAAIAAIDGELADDGSWEGPLARNARVSITERVETMHENPQTGTTISLVANRIAGDPDRFAVQLVDVGAAIRMAQARHEAELERAAAHTTRVDLERQRDDFLATTSHELRTPVTSIAGYAELLLDSPSLAPLERSWARIIARNSARLTELVEDLLTLGRARAGARPGPAPLVSLHTLVSETIAEHQPMADAKHLVLEAEVDPALQVRCTAADASRILGNLVSNAVKFTPAGGRVRVASGREGDRPALHVIDTGPGMSAETLSHAFERFYRGPDAERASTPGTGLGLAIVTELAERNHGEIRVANAPEGGLIATIVFDGPPVGAERDDGLRGSRSDS